MVTRILSATPVRSGPRYPVPPEVRDALACCLRDGDPLAAADHRPDDVQVSDILRQRADRILAALAAAGFVVTADGALSQAA